MDKDALKLRTRRFALAVIQLVEGMPKSMSSTVIGRQVMRAGTAVGANYRAACRARSRAEFIAKLGIVEEEADECIYWFELMEEANLLPQTSIAPLKSEANELLSIIIATIRSTRSTANPKSEIRNPK
ncbi:MAG: four helix bundle protein [Betaproteobacteria bacterium]|nr:four helix bundle protein [Betaproteobacteria bacterium]